MVAATSWRRAKSLFLCRMAMVWDNKLRPGPRARHKKNPETQGNTNCKYCRYNTREDLGIRNHIHVVRVKIKFIYTYVYLDI